MSGNFSKFFNDSLFNHELVNESLESSFEMKCFLYVPGSLIFYMFTITNLILLLPLCYLVIHHGLQQWRQRRSSSKGINHSDSFTYHLVAMELLYLFGCILGCCGIYINDRQMLTVWYYLFSIVWYGETFFQLLTCVEHYLAIVHPITYLNLRKEKWIRIRNVTIGFIWLLCLGWSGMIALGNSYLAVDLSLLVISVIINSYCSVFALWVLIHPGPGDNGRVKLKVDQSKMRAFSNIVIILGVLLIRCVSNLVWTVQSVLNGWVNDCMPILYELWTGLPGVMVLPLLFLHKRGTFDCGRNETT